MRNPILLRVAITALPLAVSARKCGLLVKDTERGNGNGNGNGNGKSRRPVDLKELPRSCDKSDEIFVTLPNGKQKKFKKNKKLDSAGDFRGEDKRGSSFQYVRTKDDKIFGSMVDLEEGTVSQFSFDEAGNQVMTITASGDFPPEADPEDDRRNLGDVSSNFLRGQGQQAIEAIPDEFDHRELQAIATFDILVVWTSDAECRLATGGRSKSCTRNQQTESGIRALIDLAVAETNDAYQMSGVFARLRLVHAQYVDYNEGSMGNSLSQLRTNGDGQLDVVHSLRTLYGADLVAMISGNRQYCGIGYVGPRYDLMFSVTSYACATGYYSFGHEIGHNLGCNHDKGTTDACGSSSYNYGYRDPQGSFRTMLAYNCKTGQCDNNGSNSCTRIQRMSTTTATYGGKPLGTQQIDNARHINDVRATVAGYLTAPAPPQTEAPSVPPTAAPSVPPTTAPSVPPTAAPVPPPPVNCSSYRRKRFCNRAAGCSWNKRVKQCVAV